MSGLSWDAYDHKLPLGEVESRFRAIMEEARMSRWKVLALVACANAAFCRLFGGDWVAMALVFAATLVGFFVRQEMSARKLNHLVIFVVSSFVASLVASAGVSRGWGGTPEIALATSVLFLIPGVPLMNSIIDILGGHVLIGVSRAMNAGLLIICIAIGLSATLLLLGKDAL